MGSPTSDLVMPKPTTMTAAELTECKSFDCDELKLILKSDLAKRPTPNSVALGLPMFSAACQPSPSRSTIMNNTAFLYGSESDADLEASLSLHCQASPSAMLLGSQSDDDDLDGIEDALDLDLEALPPISQSHMPCLTPPPFAPIALLSDDEHGDDYETLDVLTSDFDINDESSSSEFKHGLLASSAASIQIPTLQMTDSVDSDVECECGPNVSNKRFTWHIGCADNRPYPMSAFIRERVETMTDDEEY